MAREHSAPRVGERLGFRVDGMDCASCVGKIETALGGLRGISDIAVNLANETLSLSRDSSSSTTAKDITKKIRSLGFDIKELPPASVPAEPAPSPSVDVTHTDHGHGGAGCEHPHEHDDHRCSGGHDHEHRHGHGHGHEGACGGGRDHAENIANSCAAASSPPNISMRVEGMDCASCVGKIEVALARMPDISGVRVNFATEMLELTLSHGTSTRVSDIEKTIERLGFAVSNARQRLSSSGSSAQAAPAPVAPNQHWWQNRKGKHVIGLCLLMGSAYAIALFIPLYAEWIFAAAVVAGVAPVARKAYALAISGSPFSIETLMSVATVGALIIGEVEEAAAVVFLFGVGELLESVAATRARAGIKALASLVPKTAVLVDPAGSQREVPAASLSVDDLVLVRPGDRVPADGRIVEGDSSLDESPVTGESMPRAKATGDNVFAGSINVDGVLQVRVEKTASDNTISRIIELVEQAQSAKAPTARFIEKFSRYYTPAVMLIAALIVAGPPLALGADWHTWLYRGLALLLIACPCALVLSTPAAIAAALAVGTRRGLLIKGGNALETIGKVRAIAFDKTGTLTEGRPRVTQVLALGNNGENDVLVLAAAIEAGSSHPLAKAIITRAETAGLAVPTATSASTTAGKAVHAAVRGRRLALSSPGHANQVATIGEAARNAIEKLENGAIPSRFYSTSRRTRFSVSSPCGTSRAAMPAKVSPN